jgi:diguanylate cyclase (GGDEF)-like protein/PAS domain S-box-containing protein
MTASPKIQPKILIIEDSDDDADLLLRELRRSGIDPIFERFISADGVRDALTRGPWDIVLSDHGLPRNDFSDILRLVKEHDPELPFIVVSGSIGEENAVSLMRAGVSDFIFKGNLSRLIPAIHRELAAAAQQHARREADQRFRDIVEVSGDWIWETDAEHRYTFLSNRFEDAEWANPATAIGKTPWELAGADPDADEHWQAHLSDRQARRTFRNFLFSVSARTGSRHHVSMSGLPVFDRAGVFRGYRGTATDETRMVEAFWRAGEAETLLRDAVESISEGFLILDRNDRIVMANDALRKLYPDVADRLAPGVAYEEVLRAAIVENVYPDARGREADWLTTRLEDHRDLAGGIIEKLSDGRWVMCTERRMSNGGIAGLRMDITALKKAEAQRDHLAYHDVITGLPNKAVFTDRLTQAIGRIQGAGGALAVVCLELASLNDIRDSLGLEAGDEAIREVGQRLKNTVARGETVAHIGAGQFLVLRLEIEDDAAALTSIERLLFPLSDRLHIQGVEVPLRIAVGASTAPGDSVEPDALIRNATTAMHKAKSRPAQRYQFYSSEMTNVAASARVSKAI